MEEARLTGSELGAAKEEISWKKGIKSRLRNNLTNMEVHFNVFRFNHLRYAEYDLG